MRKRTAAACGGRTRTSGEMLEICGWQGSEGGVSYGYTFAGSKEFEEDLSDLREYG